MPIGLLVGYSWLMSLSHPWSNKHGYNIDPVYKVSENVIVKFLSTNILQIAHQETR